MDDDRPATAAEADRAYATALGEERPEQAWILSDRDVWYANPYYKGPPVPHPEDYGPEDYDPVDELSKIGQELGDVNYPGKNEPG